MKLFLFITDAIVLVGKYQGTVFEWFRCLSGIQNASCMTTFRRLADFFSKSENKNLGFHNYRT